LHASADQKHNVDFDSLLLYHSSVLKTTVEYRQ